MKEKIEALRAAIQKELDYAWSHEVEAQETGDTAAYWEANGRSAGLSYALKMIAEHLEK